MAAGSTIASAASAAVAPELRRAESLHQARQYREALAAVRPLIEPHVAPGAVGIQALRVAGGCLFQLAQPAQAARLLEQVVMRSARPLPGDWLNLASALDEAQQFEDAETAYLSALELKPRWTAARLQWCALLRRLGRQAQAQAELDAALAALPGAAPARERALLVHAQGVVALELGGYAAARPFLERALALDPLFPEARFQWAMSALAQGDTAAGWAGFEWRWGQSQATAGWRAFGDGPPTPAEQLPVAQVRGQEWHVPLMSLPHRLGEHGYPPVQSTVSAPPERLAVWRERLEPYRAGRPLQVGLVWSGTRVQTMSVRRNLGLAQLEPWLREADENTACGVQWHSLQVGPAAGDIALSRWQGRLVDWSHHLKDFGETAALALQLDLVISVDTSTAHLAASLGVPTWVLSRFDGCWRWLLGRDDSPWYPSLRLFRQPEPFDWDSVVARVGQALVAHGRQKN